MIVIASCRLKARRGLKVAVVGNETPALNAYRSREFKLDGSVDCCGSSCFVQVPKPDAEIFPLALGIARARVPQVIYIDNTAMFAQVVEGLGIRSILHTDYTSTRARLATLRVECADRGKEPW